MTNADNKPDRSIVVYEAVHSAPQIVQVDYRRREDIAYGVRTHMEAIWPKIALWRRQLKSTGLTGRQKVEIAAMCLGAIINLMTKPDGIWSWSWHWGFGAWMALVAWISYFGGVVEQLLLRRDLERLQDVERDALGRWVSAGAHESDFWAHRDVAVIIADAGDTGNFEQSSAAEAKRDGLWVTIQETIYCRACGDMFALDSFKIAPR